jgi:glycosyltransferase involved in cell wall biosynthesis
MAAQRKKPVLVSPPNVGDLHAQLVKRGMVAPLLSVVVPVKNEEDGILPFVQRVGAILDGIAQDSGWEILFVDDGSTDATLAAIVAANQRDPRVRALSLSRNFGKEAALSAGLDHARGEAVIPMDVDMQDPPEVLPEMVAKWREGHEMVFGVRRCRSSDGWAKRVTASLYYRAHNAVSSDKIPENAGDFRLMDRKVVDVIRAMPERNRFMKGLFAWAGFRQAAVEYDRAERETGKTKYNYWKLWTLALDGITSASTVPLRHRLCERAGRSNHDLRQSRSGLRFDHGLGAVPRRHPVDLARRARRICRPHPDGDQAATAVRGARHGRD